MDILLYALLNKKIENSIGLSLLDKEGKINATFIPEYLLSNLGYAGIVSKAEDESVKASINSIAQSKLDISENEITLVETAEGSYGSKECEGLYFIVEAPEGMEFASLDLHSGDWLCSAGNSWQKVDNTDSITGIKGEAEEDFRTSGNIILTPQDIGVYSKAEVDEKVESAGSALTAGDGIKIEDGVISVDLPNLDEVTY